MEQVEISDAGRLGVPMILIGWRNVAERAERAKQRTWKERKQTGAQLEDVVTVPGGLKGVRQLKTEQICVEDMRKGQMA